MRQLSSPPASARAFADWMIDRFSNPHRPLASVDMLLGEADLSYQPPAPSGAATVAVQVEVATVAAMSEAAIRWKARGDAEPGSLLLFYFCGHGISKGEDFALVASDFGGHAARPLRGLVDVPRFLTGMSDCASTDQCYFIDACRTSSDSLVEAENWGDPLLDRLMRPTKGLAQCVYYSTLGGATAHGTKGQPSDYTAALLKALDGAGASNSEGDWRINTTRLFEAVNHLMRSFADPSAPPVQVPQSGSQVTFELHRIVGEPEVPFLVGFGDHAGSTPPPSLGSVVFRQDGADIAAYPPPVPPLSRQCDWRHRFFETWLASGMTELELIQGGVRSVRPNCYLQPPGMTLRGQ